MPSPKLRIGTSGYQYPHWRGLFYPSDLPHKEWFQHYQQHFDSVEINNTFYQLPGRVTFQDWHDRAAPGFCYILKYSRYGSHLKRLKDPQRAMTQFLDRARLLKPHLGPILVQLPPHWRADPDRLAGFLEAAPRSQRWALEFRDVSWLCDDVYGLLRRHKAALCIHDMIDRHPVQITARWVYLRFHGPGGRINRSYSPQALAATARRIRQLLHQGLDVYAFFNNDVDGHAVRNAQTLKRYLHIS